MTDLKEIRNTLVSILQKHGKSFKVAHDTEEKFEVNGTVEAMQGKKKVDGIYFASVVPKPKDIRFYFFPLYTHKDQIGDIPENLQKSLKGKTCFHIKKMDEDFVTNLEKLVDHSVELYRKDGLLE